MQFPPLVLRLLDMRPFVLLLLLPLVVACTLTSIGTGEAREEPEGAVQVLNSRGVPRVSAAWRSPDTIVVTTWGSSSCATCPVSIERSGAHEVAVRVRRTEDAAGCTADAVPTSNDVRLPDPCVNGRPARCGDRRRGRYETRHSPFNRRSREGRCRYLPAAPGKGGAVSNSRRFMASAITSARRQLRVSAGRGQVSRRDGPRGR